MLLAIVSVRESGVFRGLSPERLSILLVDNQQTLNIQAALNGFKGLKTKFGELPYNT